MTAGIIIMASANAGYAGNVVSKSTSISVINQLPAITLNVTPEAPIQQSNITADTILATGEVSTASVLSTGQNLALRWSPGHGIVSSSSPQKVTYNGKNNNANQLRVTLNMRASDYDVTPSGWLLLNGLNEAETNFRFEIKVDGAQNVNPDTYTMYMDAGVYSL